MILEQKISVKSGSKITLAGAFVNLTLVLLKFTAGIIGNSQALIADAVHSISDLFTDIVVLAGIKIGQKEPDEGHTFGHARLETLASFIVGASLIVTALYLGYKSISSIYHHKEYYPGFLALIGALVSIILKEFLYQYTVRIGKKLKSNLIIANAWHHRSDSLSSVAVLLGISGAMINPEWHILDSYAALIVSFFIIKVGLTLLSSCLKEFTDAAPSPEILKDIRECTLNVAGVINIHDLKVRTSGGLYQIEAHIVVDGNITVNQGHVIAKEVEKCIMEKIEDMSDIILHVDPAESR